MRHAVVIEAVRTPVGRAHAEKGIFRDVRADDLSADIIKALLERTGIPPALTPSRCHPRPAPITAKTVAQGTSPRLRPVGFCMEILRSSVGDSGFAPRYAR